MKKTILSVVSLLIVSAIGLASCDELDDLIEDTDKTEQEKEEENKDFSVSINNLATYYLPTDTIAWEDVSLTLTFKDTSLNSITLTKGAFDTEELGEEDEFILYTSGLYELSIVAGDEIPEGNYSISYYLEYEGEPYTGYLMSVLINSYPEEVYTVYSFTEPEFIEKYAQNLKRVNSEEDALESEFYATPEYYEIGDDNPFIYQPELILWDGTYGYNEEGIIMNLEYPNTYSATASVTHLVDGEEEEVDLASNEYVSYSNFAFDFTEDAIGEVFTVTITLNNFTLDIHGHPIPSYSLTVKVEDGYNVYNAIDLGRMSLVDNEKLDEEGLSVSDFEYGESYYNIFY
ncbi:MAG: hypothetical protein LUB56_02060, partial [Coprobacillus sp.]|nr:hypothetical protein [Coprobacillus sp.]